MHDIQIVGIYIDRAFSVRTDNRPDFQKVIKDSASKKFELIIVWKLDRFARDRYDSAHYEAALRKKVLKLYLLPRRFPKVRKVSLWKQCLKVWRNITLPNFSKRSSVVLPKTLINVNLMVVLCR